MQQLPTTGSNTQCAREQQEPRTRQATNKMPDDTHNVPNLAMSTHSIAFISYTLFVLCTSRQQTSLKLAVREQVECIKKAARPCVHSITYISLRPLDKLPPSRAETEKNRRQGARICVTFKQRDKVHLFVLFFTQLIHTRVSCWVENESRA